MLVNVRGTITVVGQKRSGVSAATGNAWAIQEFVVVDENNHMICFEAFGEENICKFSLQQKVNISCLLSSREYDGRYYTTLRYVVPQVQQSNTQTMQETQRFQQNTQQHATQQPTFAQPMQATQPQFNQSAAPANDNLPF